MNEHTKIVAIILGILCGAAGFWAGYRVRGTYAGRERNTLTTSLERHRRELESLGKQLGEAAELIDELEWRVELSGIVIDDAQGAVQRAGAIGNELEGLGGSTGGVLERIRSIIGLGDRGRDADGGGTLADPDTQHPP